MKNKLAIFLLSTFIVLTVFTPCQAEVEWTLHRTFKTQQPPRDVETSVNGKWVFILTERGEILIYSSNGQLRDTIVVGDSIDEIKAGPREDILFLSSRNTEHQCNRFSVQGPGQCADCHCRVQRFSMTVLRPACAGARAGAREIPQRRQIRFQAFSAQQS
jgi:hypothetical protein